MMKRYGFLAACFALSLSTFGQTNVKAGRWHARLQRKDGNIIPFELDMQYQQGKLACFIVNGQERIRTEDVVLSRDSAVIRMPLFESYFKAKVVDAGTLRVCMDTGWPRWACGNAFHSCNRRWAFQGNIGRDQ